MALEHEIKSAIASHSMWKARLQKAIDSGTFDTPIDIIASEDECYFGKWLNRDSISAEVRNSEEYKRVKDYHAKFHQVAAKVVELAISGKKIDAAKLMFRSNSEFTKISMELVNELQAWLNKVA